MKRSEQQIIEEVDRLLASYCDGRLDDTGKRRLAALLDASRESRRYYLHYLDLHMDLVRRVFEHRMPAPAFPRRSDAGLGHWLRAAAVLVISATLIAVWLRSDQGSGDSQRGNPFEDRAASATAPFAYISLADEVEWNVPSAPSVGALLGPSAIELTRGRIRIDYFNGAALTVEAPASLALETLDRIALYRGKIATRIPHGDLSFTVNAPQAVLVNMGTEFAVTVDREGKSLVHVLEGEVAVSLLGPGATTSKERSAEVGETLEIDPLAKVIRPLAAVDMARFARTATPATLPLDVTPAYVAAVKASGPLGYWRFEKLRKNRFIDNEMSPRHSARLLATLILEGEANRVGRFSTDDPDTGLFTPEGFPGINADGEYTVELWMNPAGHHWSGLASLIRLEDPATGPKSNKGAKKDRRRQVPEPCLMALECMPDRESNCWLAHPPRVIRFFHRWPAEDWKHGSTNAFTTESYTPGQWHHLVAVREKEKLSLYHNATLERSVGVDPQRDVETYHLVIGRCSLDASNGKYASRAFSGRIDEVALYDRALTAEEIRTHFHLIARP